MLESFSKQSKPMLFRRKQILVDCADKNQIFYLKQGYIRLYTVSKEGNELTLHIFSPSSIFPILWEKNFDCDKYYFESLTPVEVYSLKKDKLQEFIAKEPDASLEVTAQLAYFSKSAIKKLELKIFGNAYQQVIATILDLAVLLGKKDKREIVIDYWFTHQDIASITGLSRERVTIEINNLLNKKLIHYNNHFIAIPDIKLLETEIK